jgi:hypothetical protein
MILNSKFKPWLSVNDNHPSICGVYFDKARGVLIATTGAFLTEYPVTDYAADESGIIAPDAFKEAARLGGKSGRAVVVVKDGRATIDDGRSWPLMPAQFPNTEQVKPAFAQPTKTARVMLDPAKLWAIAQAYGAKGAGAAGLVLEFAVRDDGTCTENGAMRITQGESVGYLMPMRDRERPKTSADVKDGDMGARELARLENAARARKLTEEL